MGVNLRKRFIGQVFAQTAVPTTTGVFFAVNPVGLSGTKAEGATGTASVDTTVTQFVLVTGGTVPVAGDLLVCHEVPYWDATNKVMVPYWVAERKLPGGGGVLVSGCYCPSIPSRLTMTASRPTANAGMFQDCTFTYQPTPPQYSGLPIGAYCYLSDQSFTDQYNSVFQYYFYCKNTQFFLSRVYVSSVFGSPFEDAVRYTWTMGVTGNACSPFSLTNGRIYSGGDSSDVVTISGMGTGTGGNTNPTN